MEAGRTRAGFFLADFDVIADLLGGHGASPSPPRRIVRPPVEDQSLFVPQDAILLAANGQLNEGNLFGRAELAAFGSFNSAITGHIMRVLPKARQGHSLFAFLSTRLGLRLLRSTAIGTSVPTMHVGLLKNLPVPELDRTDRKPQLSMR